MTKLPKDSQEISACYKCPNVSNCYCVDCELAYCSYCFEQRHNKGSFLRHVTSTIDIAQHERISIANDDKFGNQSQSQIDKCNECLDSFAAVTCSACELQYCFQCSWNTHRSGALQNHVSNGSITTRNVSLSLNPVEPNPREEHGVEYASLNHRFPQLSDNLDHQDSEYAIWGRWGVFRERPTSEDAEHSVLYIRTITIFS